MRDLLTRVLTSNEINALPTGLVAAVPFAEVRLVAAHHWVSHLARVIGRGTQIVVRGRRIFWPHMPADMSDNAIAMSLLAHELVHVWQYANGLTLWRYILRERGQYHYRIDSRAYTDYGYEQQAAMMEDWMRLRSGLAPRYAEVDATILEAIIPFVKQARNPTTNAQERVGPPPRQAGEV